MCLRRIRDALRRKIKLCRNGLLRCRGAVSEGLLKAASLSFTIQVLAVQVPLLIFTRILVSTSVLAVPVLSKEAVRVSSTRPAPYTFEASTLHRRKSCRRVIPQKESRLVGIRAGTRQALMNTLLAAVKILTATPADGVWKVVI